MAWNTVISGDSLFLEAYINVTYGARVAIRVTDS